MNDAKFQIVAQYLAQFGDESVLKSLRADGALPKTVSDSLEFAFVRSSAEYREVLELRRAAYAAEGKIPPGTSADDMSDIFDSRSRIVVCKLRGRIVASARLTFHEQTDLLEHEEFLNWSADLPRRDESVEVTRACTHPEYRGARFFFPLLAFIVMTAMQARRSWVVTSSTADLVGLYERIGMIRLKRTYDNPMLNNTKHYLLIGSTNDAVLGRSVGPIIWNLVWKRAAEFAITSLDLAVDPASRVRLLLYRAVGPVVPMFRLFQNLVGVRKRRGGR
jgi:predicted GNAT family N-acyltransferase